MVKFFSAALICFSLAGFFTNDSCAQQNSPLTERIHGAGEKECYVWFETNTESYLNQYIKHAGKWGRIGKPVVTARIFNIEPFVHRLNAAGIGVTAGFKTSDVFKKKAYHDTTAWMEIARAARRVSRLTEGRPVVLENEGAVKKMLSKGITAIDYNRLLSVISAQNWPEIWFWYAPSGKREIVQQVSTDIARAVMNGMPNARLIEASSSGFSNSLRDRTSRKNLRQTLLLDPDPISIIYLDDQRKNFWKFKNIKHAVKGSQGNTVIIYPGFGDIGKSKYILEKIIPNEPQ